MKLSYFNSMMNFCNHFRSSRNLLCFSFYSTTGRPKRSSMGSLISLYNKISDIRDPKVSIVPVLDKWIENGQQVDKDCLLVILKELRKYKHYKHALESCKTS